MNPLHVTLDERTLTTNEELIRYITQLENTCKNLHKENKQLTQDVSDALKWCNIINNKYKDLLKCQ